MWDRYSYLASNLFKVNQIIRSRSDSESVVNKLAGVGGHRLHQEMDMVSVGPNFNELDLVPAFSSYTYFFENTINIVIKNYSPVFCRKHQVIQQNRHVVAFVYVIAHTAKLPKTKLRRKRRGIYPKRLKYYYSKMPRSARMDIAGVLQHVIIRGIERRDIFLDDRDRLDFVERLSQLLLKTRTDCLAWCLLSNHAHLLLQPTKGTLSEIDDSW